MKVGLSWSELKEQVHIWVIEQRSAVMFPCPGKKLTDHSGATASAGHESSHFMVVLACIGHSTKLPPEVNFGSVGVTMNKERVDG